MRTKQIDKQRGNVHARKRTEEDILKQKRTLETTKERVNTRKLSGNRGTKA